jgi:hypothetical protein
MRLTLRILRYKIKAQHKVLDLRQHPILLWHWSARWDWFAVLLIGGLAFVAVNEFAVGIILMFLSLLSLCSKLWHHAGYSFTLKGLGTAGISLIMVCSVMGTIAYMEERPWSNMTVFWRRFIILNQIHTAAKPPTYPPKVEDLTTMIPIPDNKSSKPVQLEPLLRPEIPQALALQFAKLSEQVSDFAEERQRGERALPPIDPNLPEVKTNKPWMKLYSYRQQTKSVFHRTYGPQCLQLADALSGSDRSQDKEQLESLCKEDPDDNHTLEFLSALLVKVSQKVQETPKDAAPSGPVAVYNAAGGKFYATCSTINGPNGRALENHGEAITDRVGFNAPQPCSPSELKAAAIDMLISVTSEPSFRENAWTSFCVAVLGDQFDDHVVKDFAAKADLEKKIEFLKKLKTSLKP